MTVQNVGPFLRLGISVLNHFLQNINVMLLKMTLRPRNSPRKVKNYRKSVSPHFFSCLIWGPISLKRLRECQDKMLSLPFWLGESSSLHNVLFGQYVFLPTEQAETYQNISFNIYLSGWKKNLIFEETVIFKL